MRQFFPEEVIVPSAADDDEAARLRRLAVAVGVFPICDHGRLLGVLSFSKGVGRFISDEDLSFVGRLADQRQHPRAVRFLKRPVSRWWRAGAGQPRPTPGRVAHAREAVHVVKQRAAAPILAPDRVNLGVMDILISASRNLARSWIIRGFTGLLRASHSAGVPRPGASAPRSGTANGYENTSISTGTEPGGRKEGSAKRS